MDSNKLDPIEKRSTIKRDDAPFLESVFAVKGERDWNLMRGQILEWKKEKEEKKKEEKGKKNRRESLPAP